MTSIVHPTVETFPFDHLKILPPIKATGGAYITKIEYNHKPLYVQTCKSKTKQGIVKSGKRQYCDLMFDSTSEEFIQWIEHLENYCQECIYKKRDSWFTSNLEKDDIENAFISPLRLFKSGKYYLLKTQVLQSVGGGYDLNVFDEQQKPLSIEDIHDDTCIISIIEIQGIKFSQNKFQLEIILKSVMIINENPSFNECLFNLKTSKEQPSVVNAKTDIHVISHEKYEENTKAEENVKANSNTKAEENTRANSNTKAEENVNGNTNNNNNVLMIEKEDVQISDLKEVDEIFAVEDLDKTPSLKIKERNEIYVTMYKKAKSEAKLAKKKAIEAYLKAKKIKDVYLSDLDEDSASDEEDKSLAQDIEK
jgi:hypothetical protein